MLKLTLIFFFGFLSFNAHSQITISQMANLPIGESYKLHEIKIKSLFDKKPIYWRTENGNAFMLEYEDVVFDNLGMATISLRYFQNRLVTAEVKIKIPEGKDYQIKNLQALFENEVNSKLKTYKRSYTKGSITSALTQIAHCNSTNGEGSQNSIYSRVWTKYSPKQNDTIQIGTGTYISSYEQKPCRVVLVYRIYGVKLYEEDSKGRKGLYMKTSEYSPQRENNIKDNLKFISDDQNSQIEITLKDKNGIYSLPVKINNTLTLDFVLDKGAADVNLGQDVFSVLVKSGSIKISDYIGEQRYQLADGTTIKSNLLI